MDEFTHQKRTATVRTSTFRAPQLPSRGVKPAALPSVGAGRTVLIGFAEALAGIEAAWSLLDSGFRVLAFTRRGRRPPLRRCPDVGILEIPAPELDARASLAYLRQLVNEQRPAALMPLDDHSVWLCSQLGDTGATAVVGPTGGQADLALDKRLQLEAAARAGLQAPPTQLIRGPGDIPGDAEFPMIIKPARAVEERDGRLVKSPAVVCVDRGGLDRARELDGELLLQPWIEGAGTGTFGLAGKRGVELWSAHRRIRMVNPRGAGSSACAGEAVDDQLAQAVEGMLAAANWRGIFMVESLLDANGNTWFVEFNGRAWGSLALARRVGLEYPAWAVARALDPELRIEVTRDVSLEGLRCRHLGRELVHLLSVLRGPGSAPHPSWPSRLRTLLSMLRVSRSDRLYNWRRGRTLLMLDDTVQTLARTLGRRRAR